MVLEIRTFIYIFFLIIDDDVTMDEDFLPSDGDEDDDDGRIIKKRKQYPKGVREAIWNVVESRKIDGVLPWGAVNEIRKQFKVHRKIVERVIERGEAGLELGVVNFADRRVHNTKLLKYDPEVLKAELRELPIQQRGTNRDCAYHLGLPLTTFFHYTKKHGVFHSVSVSVKPKHTAWHRQQRMAFIRERIDIAGVHYEPQFDTIHIDEKFFHVDKKNRRVFLAEGEEMPHRDYRNINYIEKVMFLAAVARPWRHMGFHNNYDAESWSFDGKVGLYPLIEERAALRGDRRTGLIRGDNIITPVSITAQYFEHIVIEKLLPDIALKCPRQMINRRIRIQCDNASPHQINAERFNNKCQELGIDCSLIYQPPQSPDLNICDLSFFNSIQSLYYKIPGVNNVRSCVDAVAATFNAYEPKLLNRAFLSLFQNYNLVLQHEGSNKYQVPHMGKQRLENIGELPITILVHDFVVPDNVLEDVNEEEIGELVDNNFDGIFNFHIE
jgi:hypothetical protein